MSKHKHIDKICCIAVVFALLLTVVFMNGDALGIKRADTVMGYENRLFDSSRVHTIDIVMDDWNGFIDTCRSEEYSSCSVVIDGEAYTGVGIRGKGNTSLSSVASMGSERYSFKIEFDQYDSTKSYYGLDKLSLNNLIQDNTFMKDYLAYRLMGEFGADAPLCSYVYITVNGEDWGLYLAVEGVEDAFLQRNYGSDYGELYKPDSMSFGGGRGNGKDFNFDDFDFGSVSGSDAGGSSQEIEVPQGFDPSQVFGGEMSDAFDPLQMGGMDGQMPEGFDPSQMSGMDGQMPEGFDPSQMSGMGGQMPGGFDPSQMGSAEGDTPPNMAEDNESELQNQADDSERPSFYGSFGGKGGFGMGSSNVKLQYIDDNPDSYSNIFNNAKTDITNADMTRLIESLKSLSNGKDIPEIVNIDEVIRYFVVHNFVVNGDSYTGSMIHNYYLYEENGKLSMIPWDYNLAYGTFMGADASGSVNDPIDLQLNDRPMIDWIFSNEEYTELYHQYFSEFISEYFDTGYVDEMIASTTEMIAPYVEKDPTKFCTYEDFVTGAKTIREFCNLRAESVSGQLGGTIPSTSSGQSEDNSALVDTSGLTISAMGNMGNSMGGDFGGFGGGRDDGDRDETSSVSGSDAPDSNSPSREDWQNDGGFDFSNFGSGNFPSIPSGGENGGFGGFGSRPGRDDTTSNSDMPFNMGDWQREFPGQIPGAMNTAGALSWILLVASVIVLAVGLIIVFKYKR